MSQSATLRDPAIFPLSYPELTTLPESDRQQALERFRLLQPHLEEGKSLALVAREAGIPYRTVQRWVALY